MRKAYLAGRKARGGPRNERGELSSFPEYAEYACMSVIEMPFGNVEWL